MSWLVLVESNTTGSGRLFCDRARALGLRPVMFARDPARYTYLASDGVEARVVDTTDPAAVRSACGELGGPVEGVTSSSEYSIATAGEVARALGLPHPDPEAVRACRDKAVQRDHLRRAGVPGAEAVPAATAAAAVAAADRIGYPVVVKPVSGSGSIATRRCIGAAEVAAAAAAVLASEPAELELPPQHVVVEEYLTGQEYSVETFDETVVGVTHKHLGPEPYFVETGHDFPAPLPAGTASAIGHTALTALRALGLGWGPAHVELRLTPTGPRIVEVNPRLAGGMIPRLVEVATGIDLIHQAVARTAARAARASVPVATHRRVASIRFLVAEAAGCLVGIDGVAAARRMPGVVEVGLTRAPGEQVRLHRSFRDRLGYVIATAGDHITAASVAEAGRRALTARIAPPGGGSA